MIIQFSVISKTVTEDLPRVSNRLERLGLACSHFGGFSRQRANSRAQVGPWVVGVVATITLCELLGCGEVYLGERKWTCNKQATEYKVTDLLRPNDKLWRFNDEDLGREVNGRGDLTVAPLATVSDHLAGLIRMGGEGASLVSGVAASSSPLAAAPQSETELALGPSITYALWISLPKSWLAAVNETPQKMVLLSTMTGAEHAQNCGGHELALQGQKDSGDKRVKVSLVFSYFDATCSRPPPLNPVLEETRELTDAGLDTLDAWGLGKWYHVAASVRQGEIAGSKSTIKLYWDGVEVSSSLESQVSMQLRTDMTTKVHVGSDPLNAQRFEGHIDDVALLQRALTQAEVQEFRLNSWSKFGLDGLRWATWDAAWSSASWNSQQAPGVAVDCRDDKSSGCGASASLDWRLKVNDLDHIVLSGDLPERMDADLLLADGQGGRQFCKWSISGIGGADYHLAVRRPAQGRETPDNPSAVNELKWCRCDTCDCEFDVKAVMIGSEWTKAVGLHSCILCGLQHVPSTISGLDNYKWSRGAKGPNDFCWRPIAYEAKSQAHFVESPTKNSVKATLGGPSGTTALLAADFGTTGYRLVGDKVDDQGKVKVKGDEVVICANLPAEQRFQIILKSANEAYCEIQVEGTDKNDYESTAYPVDSSKPLDVTYCTNYVDNNNRLLGEDKKLPQFDPDNVRYLGIQKSWSEDVDVTIRIDSVNFSGDRKSCPKPSVLAGHVQ